MGRDTHTPSMVAPGSEAMAVAPCVSRVDIVLVAWSSHKCGMCSISNSCNTSANIINGVSNGVSRKLDINPHTGI